MATTTTDTAAAPLRYSGNPLTEDVQLKRLLNDITEIPDELEFKRWKDAFLDEFKKYLHPTATQNANRAFDAFSGKVVSLAKDVRKMEDFRAAGDMTADRCSVQARRCLGNFFRKITELTDTMDNLVPGTNEEEIQTGFTKFNLGAVLVRDGFREYDRLEKIKLHLASLRTQGGLDQVADSLTLAAIDRYGAAFTKLLDILADLGLYEAMDKCTEFIKGEWVPVSPTVLRRKSSSASSNGDLAAMAAAVSAPSLLDKEEEEEEEPLPPPPPPASPKKGAAPPSPSLQSPQKPIRTLSPTPSPKMPVVSSPKSSPRRHPIPRTKSMPKMRAKRAGDDDFVRGGMARSQSNTFEFIVNTPDGKDWRGFKTETFQKNPASAAEEPTPKAAAAAPQGRPRSKSVGAAMKRNNLIPKGSSGSGSSKLSMRPHTPIKPRSETRITDNPDDNNSSSTDPSFAENSFNGANEPRKQHTMKSRGGDRGEKSRPEPIKPTMKLRGDKAKAPPPETIQPTMKLKGDKPKAPPPELHRPTMKLKDLSIPELKRILTQRGIDFSDCIEKSELVELVQQSNSGNGKNISKINQHININGADSSQQALNMPNMKLRGGTDKAGPPEMIRPNMKLRGEREKAGPPSTIKPTMKLKGGEHAQPQQEPPTRAGNQKANNKDTIKPIAPKMMYGAQTTPETVVHHSNMVLMRPKDISADSLNRSARSNKELNDPDASNRSKRSIDPDASNRSIQPIDPDAPNRSRRRIEEINEPEAPRSRPVRRNLPSDDTPDMMLTPSRQQPMKKKEDDLCSSWQQEASSDDPRNRSVRRSRSTDEIIKDSSSDEPKSRSVRRSRSTDEIVKEQPQRSTPRFLTPFRRRNNDQQASTQKDAKAVAAPDKAKPFQPPPSSRGRSRTPAARQRPDGGPPKNKDGAGEGAPNQKRARTPAPQKRDKTPAANRRDKAPGPSRDEAVKQESPNRRDKTPSPLQEAPKQEAPKRDRTPAQNGRDKTPAPNREDAPKKEAPNRRNESLAPNNRHDKTPSTVVPKQEAPKKDSTPALNGRDKTPAPNREDAHTKEAPNRRDESLAPNTRHDKTPSTRQEAPKQEAPKRDRTPSLNRQDKTTAPSREDVPNQEAPNRHNKTKTPAPNNRRDKTPSPRQEAPKQQGPPNRRDKTPAPKRESPQTEPKPAPAAMQEGPAMQGKPGEVCPCCRRGW